MKIPIENLRDFCKKEEIQYLAIFGSVAEGTDGPESDIDMLISFKNNNEIGLLRFINVKNKLSDILCRKVDLVSRNAINPKIKSFILNNLIEVCDEAA